MSDVSKTNDLVTEARSGKYLTPGERYELIDRLADALADALETAARVPVQGEPNDDREALKRIAEEASVQRLKDSIEEWRKAIGAAYGAFPDDWELEFWHAGYRHGANAMIEHQVSRATVPDAATEPKNLSIMNGWLVELVGEHTCGTGPDGYYGAHEPGCGYEPHLNLADLEGWPGAECDAATAAIERVRAAVEKHKHWNEGCGWDVPTIEVLAALDGAPELTLDPDVIEFRDWTSISYEVNEARTMRRTVVKGDWERLPIEGENSAL